MGSLVKIHNSYDNDDGKFNRNGEDGAKTEVQATTLKSPQLYIHLLTEKGGHFGTEVEKMSMSENKNIKPTCTKHI